MKRRFVILPFTLVLLILLTGVVLAEDVPDFDFGTPLFGLAASPDRSLLVADASVGIVELRKGVGSVAFELPGVSDIAPIGRGAMFAITAGGPEPGAGTLYRVSRDEIIPVADLIAYENDFNPAGGPIDSNPYDVAALNGGKALVADAAGNDLLIVDNDGNVDWVATFPNEMTSTANFKELLGCPDPLIPELTFFCFLPDEEETEPVTTSVAIGPDGAYYVGELKGFPGPVGESKVWRVEPGTLNAECGSSPACTVVYDDFTSIVDLAFSPDGTLYVVELDENSFMALELEAFFGIPAPLAGGTINACAADGSGCTEVMNTLMPIAVAFDKKGTGYAAVGALVPELAEVVHLP